jgi:hypothetical protein
LGLLLPLVTLKNLKQLHLCWQLLAVGLKRQKEYMLELGLEQMVLRL